MGSRAALIASTSVMLALAFASAASAGRHGVDVVTELDGDSDSVGGRSPSITPEGRFVAFAGAGDAVSDADNDGVVNVYVRDMQTGAFTLVSRADGPDGGPAVGSYELDGGSFLPSISADGRVVAFESTADNFSEIDDDSMKNLFVRDLTSGTTTLVNRADGVNGAAADAPSDLGSISADGRFVAFSSEADNLTPERAPGVFVRDLQLGTTTLVSRATGVDGAPAGGVAAAISANGRFAVFSSSSDHLSQSDDDDRSDVFARDLWSNTTTLVSRANGLGGAAANDDSTFSAISRDGRFVAFQSDASNLSVADDDAVPDVFVRDLKLGTTKLVSRADGIIGAAAHGDSILPSISDNGRFVAFQSSASGLSPIADHPGIDVFVRDVELGTTTLVNQANGVAGNGEALRSFDIAGGGRFVAFMSRATNLSPADDDPLFDLYRFDYTGMLPSDQVWPPKPGDPDPNDVPSPGLPPGGVLGK
jgi:Tol biopolymer transport system component